MRLEDPLLIVRIYGMLVPRCATLRRDEIPFVAVPDLDTELHAPETPGTLNVQRPVVHKQAFVRASLGDLKRELIDLFIQLPHAQKAG